MWVHCSDCAHEWVPIYLPAPIPDVVKATKGIICPYCRGKNIYPGIKPKPTSEGDAERWIVNGDTGTSSITIWSVMRGVRPKNADVPYDPDDFGRCYRLLKVMPAWRGRLSEVADAYPKWRPLVEAWDELTALYEEELPSGWLPKTYNRMLVLRGEEPDLSIPATRPEPPKRRRRRR